MLILILEIFKRKLQVIIGEDNLYTNLGLLLSDQCLHTLKIAVFEGKEKGIFKDRKEFKGSLLKQIAEAFEYIDFLNKTKATFEGLFWQFFQIAYDGVRVPLASD